MVMLKHDEKLQDGAECAFQCTLLYTTVYGQRRIRVSTLSLPCTTMLSNLFRSADLDTQFACFLKQVANEIPTSLLLQVREQVTTLCISILHSYRKFCATVSSAGQLILPEALKLLPLYTLENCCWLSYLDCCALSIERRSSLPTSPTSALGVRKRKSSKKRPGSQNSSFDYRREEQLHRIPGRMFLNDSSEVASLFTQQGKKGTNQDAMIVWENFGSRTDTIFCGVFDGHGPYGHMVAKRVRDSLPLKLSAHWEVNLKSDDVLRDVSLNTTGSMNSESTSFLTADEESRASVDVEETEKHLDLFQALKDSFLKAYKVMDRELKMHTNIDCFCSGTTAVTLVKQGQDLVISNVGDSRAVMGTRDKDDSLTAIQLTVDLKPNLPAEAERIRKCKGRVFALQDEPEVARVWLPNNDSPGLAMARAFGDFCLKDFGLISVPEISYRHLTEKDEFVVLATDGIWDVLSNKEVVDIVASAPARSFAARALVEAAVQAWRYKYPTSKVDDCAVVCLFLDSNNLSTASAIKSKEKIASMEQSILGNEKEHPSGPTGLNRSGTIRNGEETLKDESKEEADEGNEEDASLYAEAGKDWSALEGVSRVNTLLTLPRFVPGEDDKQAAAAAKTRK